jgi:hypothetical protein
LRQERRVTLFYGFLLTLLPMASIFNAFVQFFYTKGSTKLLEKDVVLNSQLSLWAAFINKDVPSGILIDLFADFVSFFDVVL